MPASKSGVNLNTKKIRARIVAEKVLGKDGKPKSVGAAMREVGYAENTANNPQVLTRSKTWKQLMDEFLPESLIAETHKELIRAATLTSMSFPRDDDDPVDDQTIKGAIEAVAGCKVIFIQGGPKGARLVHFSAPDARIRKEAVDMALKIRGRYAAEKVEITDPYDNLSNKELADKIAKLKGFLLKTPKK